MNKCYEGKRQHILRMANIVEQWIQDEATIQQKSDKEIKARLQKQAEMFRWEKTKYWKEWENVRMKYFTNKRKSEHLAPIPEAK